MKKLSYIFGTLGIATILLLIIMPILWRSSIKTKIYKIFAQHIQGTTHIKNFNTTFFKHFPHLTISLSDIHIVKQVALKNDTLFKAKALDIKLNPWKAIIKKKKCIHELLLDEPLLHIKVDMQGKRNINIIQNSNLQKGLYNAPVVQVAMGSKKIATTSIADIDIAHLKIKNGCIRYSNLSKGVSIQLIGIQHQGTGSVAKDTTAMQTAMQVHSVKYVYQGIPYKMEKKMDCTLEWSIHMARSMIRVQKYNMHINGLLFCGQGGICFQPNKHWGNISFASQFALEKLLSLVPPTCQKYFHRLQASGNASLHGTIQGDYTANIPPKLMCTLELQKGMVQYSDSSTINKNLSIKKIPIHNLLGSIHMHNNKIEVQKIQGDIFGGQCTISGLYSISKASHSSFNLKVKANQLLLSKAFQQLANHLPNIQNITGNLSGDFVLKGILIPKIGIHYPSLQGKGWIGAQKAQLASPKFLQSIAKMANITQYKKIVLDNLKIQLNIKKGEIHTQPFTIPIGQYMIYMQGSNDFNGQINYKAQIKTPSSNTSSNLLSLLGLTIPKSMLLNFSLTGNYTNPSIRFLGVY